MKGKDFLKDIWNMVEVNRPGFVLEEPAFRYQSLSVNKSIEQIYQNRYQKYAALNAGRTDNVGVIMESKKSTAIELTHKYIEKMEQLGFSKEQIVKIIEEGK